MARQVLRFRSVQPHDRYREINTALSATHPASSPRDRVWFFVDLRVRSWRWRAWLGRGLS